MKITQTNMNLKFKLKVEAHNSTTTTARELLTIESVQMPVGVEYVTFLTYLPLERGVLCCLSPAMCMMWCGAAEEELMEED